MAKHSQSQDKIIQDITKSAVNNTEANVYSLDNPYLNKEEKLEVEMWYQLPGNIMIYTFFLVAISSVFSPLSWEYIIGIPIGANVIIGVMNWFFYNERIIYTLYLTVLHSWISYLAGFGTAAFLFLNGSYILAIISLLAPFGIFAFAEPHLLFYGILARKYRMHPKYVFFKKKYNYTFPFEQTDLR